MKAQILALCVFAVSGSYIEEVAKNAKLKAVNWEVENPEESRFQGWTEAEIREFLNFDFTLPKSAEKAKRVYARNVPEHFDVREEWPGCVGSVRDEGPCASGWAFSAVKVLEDRFCIDAGFKNLRLSAQVIISCDGKNPGAEEDKSIWHSSS